MAKTKDKTVEINTIKVNPVEFVNEIPGYPRLFGKKGIICNVGRQSTSGGLDTVSFSFYDFGKKIREGEYYGGDYLTIPFAGHRVRLLSPKEVLKFSADNTNAMWERVPLRGCSLGADPEIFVVNGSGSVIPAFDFLPSKNVGNPYWDGFQAEFTVSPGGCMANLTDRVQHQLSTVINRAKNHNERARLSWKSVLDIPPSIMARASNEHVDLGCEPSKNARPNVEPLQIDAPKAIPFRFAGCHVHLGIGKKTKSEMSRIVKVVDKMFGPVSVALFSGMEDPRRRMFYGCAGEYRTPKWGLEYRVPSSAMMIHPVIFHLCFETIRSAVYVALSRMEGCWKVADEDVVRIINHYDVKAARKVIKNNLTMLKGIFNSRFGKDATEKAIRLIEAGPHGYWKDADNIEKNWRHNREWRIGSESANCHVRNVSCENKVVVK